MKNYQRRKVFIKNDEVKEFKSYTKDGFYYKSTKNLWFWKGRKNGKPFEFHAKSIEELKIIKKNNFIGKGNYEHKNDSSLNPEHTSTEEFGKKTGLGGKEYISMLLKRAVLPINENDNRGAGRKKKGMHFIKCLEKSDIHFEQIIHKRKVWIFKNASENNLRIFKNLWYEKK